MQHEALVHEDAVDALEPARLQRSPLLVRSHEEVMVLHTVVTGVMITNQVHTTLNEQTTHGGMKCDGTRLVPQFVHGLQRDDRVEPPQGTRPGRVEEVRLNERHPIREGSKPSPRQIVHGGREVEQGEPHVWKGIAQVPREEAWTTAKLENIARASGSKRLRDRREELRSVRSFGHGLIRPGCRMIRAAKVDGAGYVGRRR